MDNRGKPLPSQLDSVLKILEQQTPITSALTGYNFGSDAPVQFSVDGKGQIVEQEDPDGSNNIANQSPEEAQAAVDAQLTNSGMAKFASK